jgi:hypothetical protein
VTHFVGSRAQTLINYGNPCVDGVWGRVERTRRRSDSMGLERIHRYFNDTGTQNRDTQREVGQPGTQQCVTELSCNGTTQQHVTPRLKPPDTVGCQGADQNKRQHHQGARSGTSEVNLQACISLLTQTLPLAPEVGTDQHIQPTCSPGRVQTDITST